MRSFVLNRARASNFHSICHDIKLLIGEEAMAKLIDKYGGVRLYIPGNLNAEHHPISLLLGVQTAQYLAAEFGGLAVDIPRAMERQHALRNSQIVADKESGMSQRELALKYRMTTRNIRKIISKHSNQEASHIQ